MKKRIDNPKGGWQFNVEYQKNLVIKTPRKLTEIKDRIHSYLRHKRKLNKKKEIAEQMIKDLKNSKKIIIQSKVPRKLLANLEFLGNGQIKQERVKILSIVLYDANDKMSKKIIKNYIQLIKELWRYGIQEKPMKFHSNYGWNGKRVVLIDPFEVTSNKSFVERMIKRGKFDKIASSKTLKPKTAQMLSNELKKELTVKELDKLWKSKLK